MVATHSTLPWDVYVIYAGQKPDPNRPIIKVFLNPLVAWIWIGVVIVILGTLVALVPNLTTVLSLARPREPAKAQARPLVSEPATLRGGDCSLCGTISALCCTCSSLRPSSPLARMPPRPPTVRALTS